MKTICFISSIKKDENNKIYKNNIVMFDTIIIDILLKIDFINIIYLYNENTQKYLVEDLQNNFENQKRVSFEVLYFDFPKTDLLVTDFSKMAYLYSLQTGNKSVVYTPFSNQPLSIQNQADFDFNRLFEYANSDKELIDIVISILDKNIDNKEYINQQIKGALI